MNRNQSFLLITPLVLHHLLRWNSHSLVARWLYTTQRIERRKKTIQFKWENRKILEEEEEEYIILQTALKVFVRMCVNHNSGCFLQYVLITTVIFKTTRCYYKTCITHFIQMRQISFLFIYEIICTPSNQKITNSTKTKLSQSSSPISATTDFGKLYLTFCQIQLIQNIFDACYFKIH